MSYMESQMQFQIEASIELEKAICDDACDIFKETGIMPLDMKMQRDELQSQLALMKDRIDSLEKDAARYQYLAKLKHAWAVLGDIYDLPSEDEGAKDLGSSIDIAIAKT